MLHTISGKQTATVQVNTNDDTWTLATNAKINVTDMYGMLESGSGNTINVLGDINVTGDFYSGVRFQGADSVLDIGADSVVNAVNAQYGIWYEGAGGHITIDGAVNGGDEAVHGDIWAVVKNNGSLTGDNGIVFDDSGSDITNSKSIAVTDTGISSGAGGTLIVNNAQGEIHAKTGIVLTGMDGDMATVANSGLIDASKIAISDGLDDLILTNTGKINGAVQLGAGNDEIDTRHGTVSGKIFGGDGDDTFIISNAAQKIVETPNHGTDTVESTVTYTLGANLENLTLLGKKDINGTGNDDGNVITGNKGHNVLSGGAGNDTLDGGHGNDTLRGGDGFDEFVFNQGGGKDHIKDFTDDVDHINSDMVKSQADFDALSVKQVGADVVINFGGGDTLTIDHINVGKIDYNDFVVI
jgi:Ca2+-binding RTX toxin-like protein